MFIWFFGIEVDERIEAFVRYADWGGPALLQLARRAEKRLEKECAPLEEEAADHRRLVHDAVYKGSIPRAFQHSCLLLLVAEIESLALRLCTTVRDRLGGGSLSKMIGEQPGQVRTYVAKSAGLRLSKHPFEGKFIKLHTVRNSVAHAGAQLSITRNSAKVRDAAESLGFSVTRTGTIRIDLEICKHLAKEGRSWIDGLHHAVWPTLRDSPRPRSKGG